MPEPGAAARNEGAYPFLTAQWRNLVMANYEVDPAVLIDYVPPGTTLDFWQGKTYVSLIGFQFLDTRVLGAPVPFHQDFEEVNLRFYVRRVAADEIRPGVVFISEIVPRPVVGGMARLLYREPYIVAPMRSAVTSDPPPDVTYEWQAHNRWHTIAASAGGPGAPPEPRSLEEFITDRHWGYNGERGRDTLEYRVEHPRWNVWHAHQSHVDADFASFCQADVARHLHRPASLFLADGSSVTIYWRTRVT